MLQSTIYKGLDKSLQPDHQGVTAGRYLAQEFCQAPSVVPIVFSLSIQNVSSIDTLEQAYQLSHYCELCITWPPNNQDVNAFSPQKMCCVLLNILFSLSILRNLVRYLNNQTERY